MAKRSSGFTLIELVVVTLIMGILASISVPYYYKTVETTKATDSVAIGHLLGNANRMYFVDNRTYLSGQVTNSCNNYTYAQCATAPGACKLVACNYVAKQDWDGSSYNFYACNGGSGGGYCAGGAVASTRRGAGAAANYAGWGYRFLDDGSCVEIGNTPTCPKF